MVCNRATWTGLLLTVMLCSLASFPARAADARGAGGFVPGGRELFSTDFSDAPLGGFPAALRNLRGSMEVVDKDGKPMLRASDNAEFLISLPERLPEHFTLEFELITRVDYNTEEIAFEGTPTFNRGPESANVLFYRTDISVLGGREAGHAYIKIPADIAVELKGQPAEFQADVNGTTVTLYANGRLISRVPDVKFARGRVLRIFLGGHDTDLNAVHLSRMRIADASGAATVVTQQPGALPGATPDSPPAPTPMPTTTPTAPAPAPTLTGPTTTTAPTPTVLQRASTGPGTQTEDDVYVGTKRQVEGATSPLTTTPQVPSGAGTSPNTGITTSRTSTISSGGGDGDLDDLEVERRTVQGVTGPLTTTPQIPSGPVTSPDSSPDSGSSVSPAPGTPLP